MSLALQTVKTLRKASAEVVLRQTALLCVRGSLAPHQQALQAWWGWFRLTAPGRSLAWWRSGRSDGWRAIVLNGAELDLVSMFPPARHDQAPRWLELSSQPGDACDGQSCGLQVLDLPPVLNMARASQIRVHLPDATSPATLTQLGDASLRLLPLWWGTAGYAFQMVSGRPDVAGQRMAALARRHWCTQVLDSTHLQWDALRGMPGAGWLSLIGREFAEHMGSSLEALAAAAAPLAAQSVFHRLSSHGLALAAGTRPLTGDINLGEDRTPFALMAGVLQPLLLPTLSPGSGPWADPETLAAWQHRFEAPQAWLDANISLA
jgi:hypothetical protein